MKRGLLEVGGGTGPDVMWIWARPRLPDNLTCRPPALESLSAVRGCSYEGRPFLSLPWSRDHGRLAQALNSTLRVQHLKGLLAQGLV